MRHIRGMKNKIKYAKAPSGLPLVQHSLQLMLEHAKMGKNHDQ